MIIRRCGFISRMISVRPLAIFAGMLALGGTIAYYQRLDLVPLIVLAAVFFAAGLVARFIGGMRMVAFVIAAGIFVGAAMVTYKMDTRPEIDVVRNAEISGRITGIPYADSDGQRLVLRLTDVTVNGSGLKDDIRLYLRGNSDDLNRIESGQYIDLVGNLWPSDYVDNPGETSFGQYLWINGISTYATGMLADSRISGAGYGIYFITQKVANRIALRIDELFPNNSSIVKAMVLGDRSELDEELNESFIEAGVIHLLAVSGLHITTMAMAVRCLFELILGKRWSFILTIAIVSAYVLITGLKASAIRAGIMFVIAGLAQTSGRPYDSITGLAGAFIALFLINPLNVADAGCTLSFSATAGIVLIRPVIVRSICAIKSGDKSGKLCKISTRGIVFLLKASSITIAAQIGSLPLIALYYGNVAVLGIIANVLIVPVAVLLYQASLIALAISYISYPLAAALCILLDGGWFISLEAIKFMANMPLNSVKLALMPLWARLIYWFGFLGISNLSQIKCRGRLFMASILPLSLGAAIAVGFISTLGFSVTFLDVGQADSAIINAQGITYVVDTGQDGGCADYVSRANLSPEAVFISHMHDDHAGGLEQLLENSSPKAIYVPIGWNKWELDEEVASGMDMAKAMGIDIIELRSGDEIILSDDVIARVISPDTIVDDENDISLVVEVAYGESSVIFTGDISMDGEPDEFSDCSVLKVAHHGSKSGTSPNMLMQSRPEIAVISVGNGNSYGHPADEVLDRLESIGAAIYRTDIQGGITARMFKDGRTIVTVQ